MALSQEEVDRLIAEAREEVRARCEAIAREMFANTAPSTFSYAGKRIADSIAALKGNGEG
jgi:hypothetical protein